MQEGLETIKRWGFEYKTVGFQWIKRNKIADSYFYGLGYYTRQNSEMCLLATRGNPKRVSKGVSQVVETWETITMTDRILRHSEKPQEVSDKIVELMGDVPRVELFARTHRQGWDATGIELDNKDIFDFLLDK